MEAIDTELFGIVHRKQKINSKLKGNVNELKVTKILTEWTGHEFVRIPGSGSLRWRNRMDICGDIINTDPNFDFIFSVETKHVKKLGLHSKEVLRINSIVYTYFEQCQRDATASGKIPFLMIRENGMKIGDYYIFLDLLMDQHMKLSNYIKEIYFSSGKDFCLYGYRSKDLFSQTSYETLKWIYVK